jgi:hypothetical protein
VGRAVDEDGEEALADLLVRFPVGEMPGHTSTIRPAAHSSAPRTSQPDSPGGRLIRARCRAKSQHHPPAPRDACAATLAGTAGVHVEVAVRDRRAAGWCRQSRSVRLAACPPGGVAASRNELPGGARDIRGGGRLGGPAATGDRFDEVTGPAAEDVAQCGERGQAEPFRDASDQPPDLLAGQRNTALG